MGPTIQGVVREGDERRKVKGERLSSTKKTYLAKRVNNGKSATEPPAQPPKNLVHQCTRFCPECGSSRTWKDGFRYVRSEIGTVPTQRYLCRNCGYRFSEPQVEIDITSELSESVKPSSNLAKAPMRRRDIAFKKGSDDVSLSSAKDSSVHVVTSFGKGLNTLCSKVSNAKYCVSEREMKNLSHQRTRQKQAAGATTKADVKGKIIEYSWYLKKEGYANGTIKVRTNLLKQLLRHGANLYDPENVKEAIAQQDSWSQGYKRNIKYAYESFLEMEGLTWKPPKYRRQETLPFVPLESEVDQVINAFGKKVSIFLEGLKETGADPGELLRVEWTDINKKTRTLAIKHPVKGHNARILPISNHFIDRLQLLPKESERVFPMTMTAMRSNFSIQRKRKAKQLNSPRLLKLSFTSIRHWKATTEYHKTRDVLHVKQLLGHKSLQSTMVYIDIERAIYGEHREEEFTTRVAHTIEEDQELIEAGFEYVTERDKAKIYRKRK